MQRGEQDKQVSNGKVFQAERIADASKYTKAGVNLASKPGGWRRGEW